MISVSDTGIGIAKEDQETIFEEFRQVGTNYAQKREGTGLGFNASPGSSSNCTAARFGLKAKLGKGSKFTFTLPSR